MEGQQAFEVVLDQCHQDRRYDGDGAQQHQHRVHRGCDCKQVHYTAGQQVDAEQFIQRCRQESGYRCIDLLTEVRHPGVERHRSGLGKSRCGQGQKCRVSQWAVQRHSGPVHAGAAGQLPVNEDAKQQQRIATADDHQGLARGPGGARPGKTGHQVKQQREKAPAHQQQQQVVGEHHAATGSDGPQQVGEIFTLTRMALHVTDRIDRDQQSEECHGQQDKCRQHIHPQRQPWRWIQRQVHLLEQQPYQDQHQRRGQHRQHGPQSAAKAGYQQAQQTRQQRQEHR